MEIEFPIFSSLIPLPLEVNDNGFAAILFIEEVPEVIMRFERLLSCLEFNLSNVSKWPISDRLVAPDRSLRSKLPNLTVKV